MAVIYLIFSVALILLNITEIPAAIVTVVKGAFNPSAVTEMCIRDRFHDHLSHIVIKGNNLSLLHTAKIYFYSCFLDQNNSSNIDQCVSCLLYTSRCV